MALSKTIMDRFGVQTRPIVNPVTNSCATSVTQLLRNNPDRLAYVIINLGANNIYLAPDKEVSTSRGILLTSNGGLISMFYGEDFDVVGYDWYGIASGGASSVFVMEVEAE